MNREERRRAAKNNPVAEGYALYQRGQLAAAERCFRAAPKDPEATRLLGELLCDTGRAAEAVALLRRLPARFEVQYSLGNAYRLAGQPAEAVGRYQAALALRPDFAGAHHGMGLALRKLEREAEAVGHFREVVRLQPGYGIGWRDLGVALAVLGDLAGAEAALKRAVALAPGLGDAQRHLAAIRRDVAGAAEVAALAAKATDPATPMDERIDMLFTLGRLAERAGAHAAAFGHFAAANGLLRAELAKQGRGFDRARLSADVDRIMSMFTPEMLAGLPAGDESEVPVFVVGMPRAGSSLFEQIMASHSAVFGAGEQSGIGEIAARIGWAPGALWTAERLRAEAGGYLAGLRARAGGAARVVDNMPDNVFQLGLVSALFPRARVVFCGRDVRDVMISCYFQHFAQAYGFDTDLGDCAFRAAEVARLVDHWRRVLGLRWRDQSYEALLAEPEGESRGLIEFLGLEWEPGCLNFHETERAVRTASWAQVRQPLYRHAAGRWRNYERQVEAAFL